MAKDQVIAPSELDKFKVSYEYDVAWPDIRKQTRARTQ